MTYAAITSGIVVLVVGVLTAALAMACLSCQQQACRAGQDARL